MTRDELVAVMEAVPTMPPSCIEFVRRGGLRTGAAFLKLTQSFPAEHRPATTRPGHLDIERALNTPQNPEGPNVMRRYAAVIEAAPEAFWARVGEGYEAQLLGTPDKKFDEHLTNIIVFAILSNAGGTRATMTLSGQQEARQSLLDTCGDFRDALRKHVGETRSGERTAFEGLRFTDLTGMMERLLRSATGHEYQVTITPPQGDDKGSREQWCFNAHHFATLENLLFEVECEIDSWEVDPPTRREPDGSHLVRRETDSRHRAFAAEVRDLLAALGVPHRQLAIDTSAKVLRACCPGTPIRKDPLRGM